jgi:hypothetical protein
MINALGDIALAQAPAWWDKSSIAKSATQPIREESRLTDRA